ncbi:hypothetical protein ScPMuIL_003843 [Solemya velum]
MVLRGHITDPAIFAMDIKTLHVVLLSLMVVQCSGLSYEKNKSYRYAYETTVTFNDFYSPRSTSAQKDVGFFTLLQRSSLPLCISQGGTAPQTTIDVSGECSVSYAVGGTTVSKTKRACSNLEIAGQHTNSKGLFGITVANEATLVYEIRENVIQSVEGKNSSGHPQHSQSLKLLDVSPSSETITASSLNEVLHHLDDTAGTKHMLSLLPSGPEILYCTENCEKPIDVLQKFKDELVSEKMATVESAKAYLEMLRTFRHAGKETIAEVLTSQDGYYIVPQLIDIATATQTPGAQKAVLELLNFEDDSSITYQERFLLAAAFSTHPGEYLLKDLLEIMKKDLPSSELQESVALGMGALVNTYCTLPDRCKDQVISDYKRIVTEKLMLCENDSCRTRFLRSIGNSGHPQFVQILLQFAEGTDSGPVSLTAIQSLRRIPNNFITEKVLKALLRIFNQNHKTYDVTVRAAAMNVVLKNNPSEQVVRNFLMAALYDQKNTELAAFIPKLMLDIAKSDIFFKTTLTGVLKDTRLNNYLLYAQKGKSSAFTSLLAATSDTNCTYGIHQLNANSGVMKTSAMVVDLIGKLGQKQFMSFDVYAEGLESLMGNSDDSDDGTQEPTAGMSLSLMDVILRPVEFFRGSGSLMSAVWNAPSELVSALQANLLLQDHYQKFHLSNGLIVDLQVLGATSIDLSGLVSISLWNQNSHSLIKNSGALVIEGSMKLESEELQAGVSFSSEGEAFIDFVTDVEFYETPFKMCMQMLQPPITFIHNVKKMERTKGEKKYYKSSNLDTRLRLANEAYDHAAGELYKQCKELPTLYFLWNIFLGKKLQLGLSLCSIPFIQSLKFLIS